MLTSRLPRLTVCLAPLAILLLVVSQADAQFGGQAGQAGNSLPQQLNNGNNVVIPAPVIPNNQFTPQQIQAMMLMRAMSGRRGQVRTGYPQMVPSWGPGAGMPTLMPPDDPPSDVKSTSSQKRAEARKIRDDKKRAARDAGKAKNAKPDKVKVDKAKVDKKAKLDKKGKSGKKAADDDAA